MGFVGFLNGINTGLIGSVERPRNSYRPESSTHTEARKCRAQPLPHFSYWTNCTVNPIARKLKLLLIAVFVHLMCRRNKGAAYPKSETPPDEVEFETADQQDSAGHMA